MVLSQETINYLGNTFDAISHCPVAYRKVNGSLHPLDPAP